MKYIILLLTILTIGCTKEVLVENPINIDLQNQVTQLHNAISNLSATNLNLQSRVNLLESEASILEDNLTAHLMTIEDAQERIAFLQNAVDEYNIELERAQQDSFFRLNFYEARNIRVLRYAGFIMTRLIAFDAATTNAESWIEDPNYFGLVDGKDISYSTSGDWVEAHEQIRAFYNSDGVLVVAAIARVIDGQYERRDFYIEAYDYIYQFEDAIIEYITLN